MKNCSSSNGNKAGDGKDCCKHQASVTVLAIFRFGLVLHELFNLFSNAKISVDPTISELLLTSSLFHAEYLGLLVSMKYMEEAMTADINAGEMNLHIICQ